MSKCYNAPELCYNYCSNECPIGRLTMKEVEINSFDRLSLKMLGSLNDIENLRASIINISADGQVDIEMCIRDRFVSTRVFPEPAPAIISSAPSVYLTALFWLSFKSSNLIYPPSCKCEIYIHLI